MVNRRGPVMKYHGSDDSMRLSIGVDCIGKCAMGRLGGNTLRWGVRGHVDLSRLTVLRIALVTFAGATDLRRRRCGAEEVRGDIVQ